jgi:formiminoglutamate deiminase
MTTYWCERAWVGTGDIVDGLTVEVSGTHIIASRRTPTAPPGAVHLMGLTIPGFANCHSHAFHRALRGRTQRERGTFWTWRETMYHVAERVDPDSYYGLALAVYKEMVLTGITAVGEFHYLHHDPAGRPYADPNAMGAALIQAARDAGLRIALLDTCYLTAGFGAPVVGVQSRFTDLTAEGWAGRVASLRANGPDVMIGAAIHSVRAVQPDDYEVIAATLPGSPLHIHLSEQPAENESCIRHYGRTPTRLLADHGVLSGRLSAIHATHLTQDDIKDLADAGCYATFCPTTERDLADGVGPSVALASAGVTITLGSDSHAVVDFFEEMRSLELDERLATRCRGSWSADDLLTAATAAGHRSLGFADGGTIAPGQWADLVTLDVRTPRTAGTGAGPETAVFAASAADVTHVVASGRVIELDHAGVGDVLTRAIAAVVTS